MAWPSSTENADATPSYRKALCALRQRNWCSSTTANIRVSRIDCGDGGDSNAGTADGDTSHGVPCRATNFCCPSTERKKTRRLFGQKSSLKLLLILFSFTI